MATRGSLEFEKLSRRHGVKIPAAAGCSVEECSLAVGAIIGYDSIKSASRMNSAVVIFLDSVEKVNKLVESGVVLRETQTPVFPLMNPAKKVILSNVPPFVRDEVLERELSRHGQIVSTIKKVLFGCKSPLLKHVVSHRRQVHMILRKDTDELNLAFSFKIDGFDYVFYASTESMKCFGCGREGHLVRNCPENEHAEPGSSSSAGAANASPRRDEHAKGAGEGRRWADVVGKVGEEGSVDTGAIVVDQNKEGGETVGEIAIAVAEVVLENEIGGQEEIGIMEKEAAVFKVPRSKRKNERGGEGSNSKRKVEIDKSLEDKQVVEMVEFSSGEDSESESSDASQQNSEINGVEGRYGIEKVRQFLKLTKGKKYMQDYNVTDFFPESELFIDSAKFMMSKITGGGLTSPEIARLKKVVARVISDVNSKENERVQSQF